MEQVFIQLAIILSIAFIVSYIVRIFKQPLVIGYIIAGIIAAAVIEFEIIEFGASTEVINVFSQFGIAFLLFIVGLHLNPKVIKEIGGSSLIIGLCQMLLTFLLGFFTSYSLLGFEIIPSIYIGIALAFSSTIIIMKLLSDKRQLDSLYGKISIGVLIIQDLVAAGVLMFISSMGNGTSFSSFAIQGLLCGSGLIIFLFLVGFFILPPITKNIARSQELLFLFSICWCFLIGVLFDFLGFSIELGALVAGVVLSISPYSLEISSKIRPLRDFFLIIFFIILGLNIQISNISSVLTNALILSIIALIFKPVILMSFMALFGYTKRTNFLVGITLAQISEFSLIVLAAGVAMGHITTEILSTLTLAGIITITLSTYMINYSNEFYKKMSGIVSIFERKKIKKERKIQKEYDAILFGYNRIGFGILNSLKRIKKRYLVVDFNPDTIYNLGKFRIPCLYGDIDDAELLKELPLDKLKLAVSTIPDFETNMLLIETIRIVNPEAVIIVRAHQIDSALKLYGKGANYVLTPHFLGGEYVAKMIENLKINGKKYDEEKIKHIKDLTKMLEKGHEHPEVERN
ncbi:MAG: cation:proton antiporter [Nanoarchaeota archaeon]|nr:cation:proton antiporter [Nanoarchaeota archaeon]MBU4116281.1 cation:proton antiporter [Nanoarchaeota archaeon]